MTASEQEQEPGTGLTVDWAEDTEHLMWRRKLHVSFTIEDELRFQTIELHWSEFDGYSVDYWGDDADLKCKLENATDFDMYLLDELAVEASG